MKVRTIKTAIFPSHGNLLSFIARYLPKIAEQSILVVTSKIVALSEGRIVEKTTAAAKVELIRQESDFMIRTKRTYLTIKDGMVMANAGIDESNADGKIILLPRDSYRAASKIRNFFKQKHQLKDFGVIITDSRCFPLRAGITGVVLGYAGFKGIKRYQGTPDIFGRPFKYSRVDVADSLATAAVLCMGEGAQRQPLAIISGAPVEYVERIRKDDLKIDVKEDMYGPIFRNIR
ncbi:MAG: coenzyme F420-0:L-glutamate ligase [Patescibacteria group bacterium]|jgi:coenzyme F420-0:L-glutamate ligase